MKTNRARRNISAGRLNRTVNLYKRSETEVGGRVSRELVVFKTVRCQMLRTNQLANEGIAESPDSDSSSLTIRTRFISPEDSQAIEGAKIDGVEYDVLSIVEDYDERRRGYSLLTLKRQGA